MPQCANHEQKFNFLSLVSSKLVSSEPICKRQGHIQAVWETGIPVWVLQLWHSINIFQVLLFHLYFNKRYVEVVINDFTMHLIIFNGLEDKSVFIYLNVTDHKNVCFFFLISLRACSKSLNDVNSLHYFVWFLLLTTSFQFRFLCRSHKVTAIQILFLNIWIL